jgi:hypothetical protein
MKRMAAAIDQIKLSSDNTAKIVKTIDGLAFQTSLILSGVAEPRRYSASRNTEEEEAEAVLPIAHTRQKRHPHAAHAHHNSMADKQRRRSHSLPVKPAKTAEAREILLLDEDECEEMLMEA